MENYTQEQLEDIGKRMKEADETIKKLQLKLVASVMPNNVGDDTFALKVVPHWGDTKFDKLPKK